MLQSSPDLGAGTIPAISFHLNTLLSSSQPSHPYGDRMDRCIDYVWVSRDLRVVDSGLCFDRPSADDADLWPSDHVGVWADLEFATD